MRQFQNHVVRMQFVEEADQRAPVAFLDGLSAVIAEAQVHGFAASPRDRAHG